MKKLILLGFISLVALIGIKGSLFIVTEGRQAIITEFGKPIGKPITEAGLHFKLPFVQIVRFVDKRILSWDGYPNQIPTKDKKYIKVDTTARYRVTDALTFIKTVRNEQGAKARIDTILDATTRDVISNQNLVEAVRNSNSILDKIEERKKAKNDPNNKEIIEEEITGEIEKINVGREMLSTMIKKRSDSELAQFGIKLIDVQLRRISYEKSVESKVYERMISERERIAQKIKSIGKGEKAKIEGRITKDLKKIESQAYRSAQQIKGAADAKATRIYAKALEVSPKFYEFMKSMEAYKSSLKSENKYIFSSNSEFLKYLQ